MEKSTIACDFCTSINRNHLFETTDYISSETFGVYECTSCQLAYISPMPEPSQIGRYYSSYFKDGASRFGWVVELLSYMTRFWRYLIVSRVSKLGGGFALDVGCGRGLMLGIMKNRGWKVFGTELNDFTGRFAKDRGIEMRYGQLSEARFASNFFDVVTIWHVLEHVYSPSAVLSEIYRIVKPQGYIFVEVPNFSSLFAEAQKSNWFLLDVPRHLYQFRSNLLKRQIEKSGFEIVKFANSGYIYDLFSNVQFAYNRLGLSKNYMFDLLRGKAIKRSRVEQATNLVLHATLLLPVSIYAFFYSMYGWLFNSSGSVLIVGKKL